MSSDEPIGQIQNTMLVADMIKTSKRTEGLRGALIEHLRPILRANKLGFAEETPIFEVVDDMIVVGVSSGERDYLLKISDGGAVALEQLV